MVFQVAAIIGPVSAGFLLGNRLTVPFVLLLLAGCGLMVLVLGRLERVIPGAANGVPPLDDEPAPSGGEAARRTGPQQALAEPVRSG